MRRQALRIARLSAGSVLILVGVIGGFIPVLQGWVFILAGLSVLAQESDRARALLDRIRERARGLTGREPIP
jgi:uncharacterized membrane protein YbaN (DUF454 family)